MASTPRRQAGVWPNRDEGRAGDVADTAVTACHQGYYEIALTTVGTAAAVSNHAVRDSDTARPPTCASGALRTSQCESRPPPDNRSEPGGQ